MVLGVLIASNLHPTILYFVSHSCSLKSPFAFLCYISLQTWIKSIFAVISKGALLLYLSLITKMGMIIPFFWAARHRAWKPVKFPSTPWDSCNLGFAFVIGAFFSKSTYSFTPFSFFREKCDTKVLIAWYKVPSRDQSIDNKTNEVINSSLGDPVACISLRAPCMGFSVHVFAVVDASAFNPINDGPWGCHRLPPTK